MVETGHHALVEAIQDLPAAPGRGEDQPGLDEAFKPPARLQEVETVRPAVGANSLQEIYPGLALIGPALILLRSHWSRASQC